MTKKTIGLCCIAKNEEKNLRRLTESIKGCFDELYLTDTGSTDNTVALAKELGWTVSHFDWVDDFSAARNFNWSQANTDYIMWLDLDDVLTGREQFIKWKNDAMEFYDFWISTYDYAHDGKGDVLISFARERVVKRDKGVKWKYFIHEGLDAPPGLTCSYSVGWKVSHQRTGEDLARDKGRNIGIFERQIKKLKEQGKDLPPRMKFYYGKEFFENGKPMEAITPLTEVLATPDGVEQHDRVMSAQYAMLASMQCGQYEKGIELGLKGIGLDAQRSEFWNGVGDALVKLQRVQDAVPYYAAAMQCNPSGKPNQVYAGATFNFKESYTTYPRNQLTRAYFTLGDFPKAMALAKETKELFPNEETDKMISELTKIMAVTNVPKANIKDCEDVVITTPPAAMYDWDEEIYKEKGIGGSETAALEMAMWIKRLTKRNVIIFNQKDRAKVGESGVEYRSTQDVPEYFAKNRPKVHIAWRHNYKTTEAKTYLWAHDLLTPTIEHVQNFDKMICLSQFHKRHTMAMKGIPEDKIWVSRNGIVPERFAERKFIKKNPMKLCFPSSPDRGLDRVIKCLDIVRKTHPVELHVFYGFDNLRKSGPQMTALADHLEKEIAARPWITYHGNTEQKALTNHFMESGVWLHIANFIETYCITASEMLASGVYPITRTLGALQDTLGYAREHDMAYLFEEDALTEEELNKWADKTKEAIDGKYWEKVDIDPKTLSWESLAKEWIEEMGL
jgi:glycosyltransferase involved in cell wall biosynthesis